MVFDRGYDASMMAAYLFPLLWVIAPMAVLVNLVLTLRHVGLPTWARIATLGVALLVALVTGVATTLLLVVR